MARDCGSRLLCCFPPLGALRRRRERRTRRTPLNLTSHRRGTGNEERITANVHSSDACPRSTPHTGGAHRQSPSRSFILEEDHPSKVYAISGTAAPIALSCTSPVRRFTCSRKISACCEMTFGRRGFHSSSGLGMLASAAAGADASVNCRTWASSMYRL